MKYIAMTLIAACVMGLSACSSKKQSEEAPQEPKYLVLYYSQTGVTKQVADEIGKLLDAPVEAIEVENPYDGTYDETIQRVQEERESGALPTLKPMKANIADYDVIFLGYPVWFGTYAPPVAALVKKDNFAGKKIVPLCTFGSGGLESSEADLKRALPQAQIAEGFGVREKLIGTMPAQLDRFLKEQGYLEGEVEPLAAYSEQEPVTDEERKIFDEACSDYKFPLGTPVTVGKRAIPGGMDYKYEVNGKTPDGRETHSTIYVTVDSINGDKPEFTRVVR